jgi:4-amino-4-deoxy-L-arabinose transferase-like glycosyltransferase
LVVFGFTEFAARLPAAILGSGCVMITYLLGRAMFHPTVGFLGAAILATAVEFIILSRSVVHDISLAFFITLALYLFFKGYKNNRHRTGRLILFIYGPGFCGPVQRSGGSCLACHDHWPLSNC